MGLYDEPKDKAGDSSSSPDKKQDFEAYYKYLRAKDPRTLPLITEFDPFSLARERYVEIAIRELYSRIMYITLDSVAVPDEIGLSDFAKTIYDTHSPELLRGLMYYIIDSMADESKVVLRKRPFEKRKNAFFFEERTHSLSTENENKLDLVTLNFEEFQRTELLEAYFSMVFDAIAGAAKLIRIGGALVFKIDKLNELISDREVLLAIETQVKQVNIALKESRGAYIDAQSSIEMPKVDMKPTKEQLEYAYSLICNATGRPMSFINGQMAGSLNSTGDGDRKINRQASVRDFNEILRGIFESVFGCDFQLKPDIEQLPELADFLNSLEMSSIFDESEKRKIVETVLPIAELGIVRKS
ncbi:hypothetical protein HUO09_05495 [Vibrio sp. Y2-5]|uniref:DUF1073 domain-containing protein n=1 Tax=Vibrio TaxID=662 RepID=UPI00142E55E9|nr:MULTISPECIES: DUF1073 domain-containing protein [Vibrio]MBD0785786.1 hypothetical protein [Vibrio sp. Y2-5]NIY91110.1 DUF1073 domain-containing protein [Vibrio diazotrophicus]